MSFSQKRYDVENGVYAFSWVLKFVSRLISRPSNTKTLKQRLQIYILKPLETDTP